MHKVGTKVFQFVDSREIGDLLVFIFGEKSQNLVSQNFKNRNSILRSVKGLPFQCDLICNTVTLRQVSRRLST